MRKSVKIFFLLFIIIIVNTACDSSCNKSKAVHFYVEGSAGALVADISYREAGGNLVQLNSVSLAWFHYAEGEEGSFILCATNKSGAGTIKATIDVSLKESCDDEWYDVDSKVQSSHSQFYKKIWQEDASYVCLNYTN